MKWIKYIGHPIMVMSLFLLLLIEGENFGGFYLLYILMALPAGTSFALFALAGLISMFIGYKIYRKTLNPLKPFLYILGYGLMIISLLLFFSRKERLETFQLVIPVATFIIFGLCSFCFLTYTITLLFKSLRIKDSSKALA